MTGSWFHGVAAFGKIPTQGDFLRIQATSPAFPALDRWLQEGLEALRRAQAVLPQAPVYFLFRTPTIREVLIGVLAPSVDKVGRAFPLVVFGAADGALLAERFPLVPFACARFLSAATQLVLGAGPMTASDVAAQVAALPLPTAEDLAMADEMRRGALLRGRSHDLFARLFPAPPEGRPYYAFRTFVSACEPVRGQDTDRPGVTLDCPIQCDVDAFAWLDLAARLLRWKMAPPTLLWAEAPVPRLFVSLGPSPSALLLYWAKPDHSAAKFWPIVTDRPEAIAQAQKAMKPNHRSAIEGVDVDLDRLLSYLAS